MRPFGLSSRLATLRIPKATGPTHQKRAFFNRSFLFLIASCFMTLHFWGLVFTFPLHRWTLGGRIPQYSSVVSGRPFSFADFNPEVELLVQRTLQNQLKHGIFSTRGLFLLPEGTVYPSSAAAQATVYGVLYVISSRLFQTPLETFTLWCKRISALLTAASLTLFVFLIWKEFGQIVSMALYGLLLCSDSIAYFSCNSYWISFSFYLPLILGWWAYPHSHRSVSMGRLYLSLVFVLILFRALCGYEFITNIVFGTTIPVLYWETKLNTPRREIAFAMARTLSVSLIALLVALSVHATQLALYYGSYREARNALIAKFVYRATGLASSLPVMERVRSSGLPLEVRTLPPSLIVGGGYLLNSALTVPTFVGRALRIPLGIFIMLQLSITARLLYVRLARRSVGPAFLRMQLLTTWSFLCSLSWAICFRNHMYSHVFLNGWIFYLYWLLMMFVLIGMLVQRGIRGARLWSNGITGRINTIQH